MFPIRFFSRSCKKVMETISDVSVVPCTNSRFVQPYRVKFSQDGRQRLWDCTKIHDSVAVVIFNRTKNTFVLVKQFRPAVYMSKQRHLWENSEVFTTPLSQKPSTEQSTDGPAEAQPPPTKKIASSSQNDKAITEYGPGSLGCTYELCAGIVDKQVPLAQIAKEEVLEETGYDVPVANLEFVNSYSSSLGHAGSCQTVYYCEVTEDMHIHQGGGNGHEGEMIDVVHMPMNEAMELVFDTEKTRSAGVCFGLLWFQHFKKTKLGL